MTHKTVGILGGMGPEATLKLLEHIVRLTPAKRDQDHLPLVVFNLPSVPDRTAAILGHGEDPTSHLLKGARVLEAAGVDLWAMPCITAHHFIRNILPQISAPFVSIVDESVRFAVEEYPHATTAGLLATTGTIRTGLFEKGFEQNGWQVVSPSEPDQEELVMGAIYGKQGVKAGNLGDENSAKIRKAAENLIQRGAEVVIAGCTEIPLVLSSEDISVPVIDSLLVLAKALVREAMG